MLHLLKRELYIYIQNWLLSVSVCAGSYMKADFHNSSETKLYKDNKNEHYDLLCVVISVTR